MRWIRKLRQHGQRSSGYSSSVTDKPRRADELEAVRRSPELDDYVGQWVATKRGHVVAHAPTSKELVTAVRALGQSAEDAVAEFVAPPSEAWTVGVG